MTSFEQRIIALKNHLQQSFEQFKQLMAPGVVVLGDEGKVSNDDLKKLIQGVKIPSFEQALAAEELGWMWTDKHSVAEFKREFLDELASTKKLGLFYAFIRSEFATTFPKELLDEEQAA